MSTRPSGLVPPSPGNPCDVPRNSEGVPDDVACVVPDPGESALHLCHPADSTELRRIRSRVDAWADRHALPDDVVVDLQLALGEAVANGVEHAYRGTEPGAVVVDLEIRHTDNDEPVVAVRVTDHGRWRPVPLVSGYRGRGMTVIERLARRVVVSRTRIGTQICFEIPLTA